MSRQHAYVLLLLATVTQREFSHATTDKNKIGLEQTSFQVLSQPLPQSCEHVHETSRSNFVVNYKPLDIRCRPATHLLPVHMFMDYIAVPRVQIILNHIHFVFGICVVNVLHNHNASAFNKFVFLNFYFVLKRQTPDFQ